MTHGPNSRMRLLGGARTAACLALFLVSRAHAATYTNFNPSGSICTETSSINSSGAIAGMYFDRSFAQHGFVRAADGTITSFDPPGSVLTLALGLNSKGEIAGYYFDASHVQYGFVRTPGGKITIFPPSAAHDSFVSGINDEGVIAGSFLPLILTDTVPGDAGQRGFLLKQ